MATEIANNLGAFQGNIDEFDQNYKMLTKDYEETVNQMNALHAMWTGQAHDAIMNRFGEDRQTMEQMLEYMKQLLADLRYARSEYVKCENTVASIIQGLNI